MAEIFEIPITSNDASFKIRTILEEIELVLMIRWNSRFQRWILDILDSGETALVLGIPMHINLELIFRFEVPGLPPGLLLLLDKTGGNVEAGRFDLGDRVALIYEESE